MDTKPQALPTYSQWQAFKRHLAETLQAMCIYCGETRYSWLYMDILRIGCRIKVWDEQLIAHEDGTEEVKLKSRIVAVSLRGLGCPKCQELMLHAEAEEMRRYDKANEEWMQLPKPVQNYRIHFIFAGCKYHLNNGKWYNSLHMELPGKDQPKIAAAYKQQCMESIEAAVRPWMMAALEEAKVPQAKRPPSKRVPYLDVTEQVLTMPRGNAQYEASNGKPSEDEVLPDDTPAWRQTVGGK